MKSYHVDITETLRRTITVEAHDYNEAINKVRDAWRRNEIVLDAEDFLDVAYEVCSSTLS